MMRKKGTNSVFDFTCATISNDVAVDAFPQWRTGSGAAPIQDGAHQLEHTNCLMSHCESSLYLKGSLDVVEKHLTMIQGREEGEKRERRR